VLAPVLLVLLAAAPPGETFVMKIAGTPVGSVHLALSERPDGSSLEYSSTTYVRRGSARTRNSATARLELATNRSIRSLTAERFEAGARVRASSGRRQGEFLSLRVELADGSARTSQAGAAAIPSSLAFAALGPERRCIPVVDETMGEAGEACGERHGDAVQGTLLGESFAARLAGSRLEHLELPGQRTTFDRTDEPPERADPGDLFAGPVVAVQGLAGAEEAQALWLTMRSSPPVSLPSSAGQGVQPVDGGVRVRWERAAPGQSPAWDRAVELAQKVDESLPDKRPGAFERLPERALKEGRGSCVAHSEAFVWLARRQGLAARRALGLVAAEGKLWPHAWAQVEIAGRWYDVDPSEGEAPARAVRVLFAAGDAADEHAFGRLAALVTGLQVKAER
jgi:hypothetical protein